MDGSPQDGSPRDGSPAEVEIDAVIFDFDGTILDTEWSAWITVRDEFRRHGHDYPLDDHRAIVGRADRRHWSDRLQDLTGPRTDIEVIKERRRVAHHAMVAATGLRDGVIELVDHADRRGRLLAVASSSPAEWVVPHLTERGLADRFHTVVTRDVVARAKPWPDLFVEAARRLDVDPDRCLVVEDSHNGLLAAKAAGMHCVVVPNPVTVGSDLSAADLVLDSLADLPRHRFGLG